MDKIQPTSMIKTLNKPNRRKIPQHDKSYKNTWFSKKVPRPFTGESTVFSKSGGGKTGHSHAKEWTWTPTKHRIQKLSQNGSKPYMSELKL